MNITTVAIVRVDLTEGHVVGEELSWGRSCCNIARKYHGAGDATEAGVVVRHRHGECAYYVLASVECGPAASTAMVMANSCNRHPS